MLSAMAILDREIEILETRQQSTEAINQNRLKDLLYELRVKAKQIAKTVDPALPDERTLQEQLLEVQQALAQNERSLA